MNGYEEELREAMERFREAIRERDTNVRPGNGPVLIPKGMTLYIMHR